MNIRRTVHVPPGMIIEKLAVTVNCIHFVRHGNACKNTNQIDLPSPGHIKLPILPPYCECARAAPCPIPQFRRDSQS
jgi:hypothetical protein